MKQQCKNCLNYRHWRWGSDGTVIFIGRCSLSGQDVSRPTAGCVLHERGKDEEATILAQMEVGQCGNGSKTLAR